MTFLAGRYDELLRASTSSARRALLDGLALPYRAIVLEVDEAVAPGTPVAQAVAQLAERKARAVAALHPRSLVIGADQLGSLDGRALGQPADADARAQVAAMAGRGHEILTAVCVMEPGFLVTEVGIARLHVRPLARGARRLRHAGRVAGLRRVSRPAQHQSPPASSEPPEERSQRPSAPPCRRSIGFVSSIPLSAASAAEELTDSRRPRGRR